MNKINNIALRGFQQAQEKIYDNASKISKGADALDPEPILEVKEAINEAKANAKVIKVQDELTKSVLDMIV